MRTLDKAFILAGIMSLTILIAVPSCDNDLAEESETRPDFEAAMETGEWRVAFQVDGREEFGKVNELKFKFLNDGSVLGRQSNGSHVAGVWVTVIGRNDEIRLKLDFGGHEDLHELGKRSWVFVERSEKTLKLQDGGGDANALLTLERV